MSSQAGKPGSRAAQEQFGRQAGSYGSNQAVHASGDSLETVVAWTQPQAPQRAVDVATGAGFTAFAVAPHAGSVVAFDTTRPMLEQARRLAGERGLANVVLMQGVAERLPFAGAAFDLYTCRMAAHHFYSLPDALAEARRVLAPGGQAVFVDITSPEDPVVLGWQDYVERLRDPSHVRDYPESEWVDHLAAAGLEVRDTARQVHRERSVRDWADRSGVSARAMDEITELFRTAPPAVRDAFEIRPHDGDFEFAWPVLVVQAGRR